MSPQRLNGLNDSQWKALKKGLSYSRVTRFQSVREFIDALDQDQAEPFRVDEPDRFTEPEDHSPVGKYIILFLLLAGMGGVLAYQKGYLDAYFNKPSEPVAQQPRIIENDTPTIPAPEVSIPVTEPEPEREVVPATTADDAATTSDADDGDGDAVEVEQATENFTDQDVEVVDMPVVGPDPMLVDFSSLPEPTEVIPITPGGRRSQPVNIAVREDGPVLIIDFVRGSGLAVPLNLRLEEVGFSGNRSPWASGQYALSNAGLIHFPAGQARGRVSLTMASDPLREADQQSTLRLREADFADTELAVINVTLEDDDQRLFEGRLPRNTVAFASSQLSVSESDPAVQLDLIRYNPDDMPYEVNFDISAISATESQDYFAPGSRTIEFGPGQRSARLLIPLVQDAQPEGDENFAVELIDSQAAAAPDVYRRIVIGIRDDDPQTP
jgi:hypothetical protein